MFKRVLSGRRGLVYAVAGASALTLGSAYVALNPSHAAFPPPPPGGSRPPPPWTPPSREEIIGALKSGKSVGRFTGQLTDADDDSDEYDVLIVGGGATGAGVAVDAATRGLKVALVEREDWSSGTSSKSTKLVHGGVRYLQKAFLELDYEQYKLVREALHERRIFLQTAPYLSHMLPIMLPLYKWWQLPYYWAGCKAYDLLAGSENMESSYIMTKGKALEAFPMLKADGLVGALVYYDGQHNDARMNVSLIMTAVKYGATAANKTEVVSLRKDDTGKLIGARLKDRLTGDEWDVKAKGIINATGPFSDALLRMDTQTQAGASTSTPLLESTHKDIVAPSSGVHITLPNYYSPRTMGLLDPATSDGRVIFFLPWQGNTIAGTTDTPTHVSTDPKPSEEDIQWILDEVKRYLSPDIKVRRGDVLSAWSGLRPLIRDPASSNSKDLVRNHLIHVSEPSKLVTIAGGKWTTYRAMAEETVDEAVKIFGFEGAQRTRYVIGGPGASVPLEEEGLRQREKVTVKGKGGCVTERVRLVGSDGWSKNMFIGLIQRYGLETEIAKHLADNYGDRAWTVCSLAEATGQRWPMHGVRLNSSYPYIEAEVRYAVRHEYALTPVDFLARRSRLAFLNAQGALDALPRVIEIMSEELGWSPAQQEHEWRATREFLVTMGLPDVGLLPQDELHFSTSSTTAAVTGWVKEKVSGAKAKVLPSGSGSGSAPSRAHFSVEELDLLKTAWVREARKGESKEEKLVSVLRDELGYAEGATLEQVRKALEAIDAGSVATYDEFVDAAAYLKDASESIAAQVKSKAKGVESARRHIPVEKSGGGV